MTPLPTFRIHFANGAAFDQQAENAEAARQAARLRMKRATEREHGPDAVSPMITKTKLVRQ